MNYPDDWRQFSAEYQHEVFTHLWNTHGAWGPMGQSHADFQNMMLMGGEIAR